jgi:hypothetical protein
MKVGKSLNWVHWLWASRTGTAPYPRPSRAPVTAAIWQEKEDRQIRFTARLRVGVHGKALSCESYSKGRKPMTVTHTHMHPETVAVLGAGGTMGFPIARNIARAGIPVRAWNRSRDEAEPLARDGVRIADTPADAARGAGVVITMLDDGEAVAEAMDGPDGALAVMPGTNQDNGNRTDDPNGPPQALWVQMTTIGQVATKRCAELANRAGVGFVDAPVLGTRQPAEQRRLIVLESGPEEARPRTQPVFDAIADRTAWAGQAGAGSRLKLLIETRADLDARAA